MAVTPVLTKSKNNVLKPLLRNSLPVFENHVRYFVCFTLVNEAIRLGVWPRNRVIFPGTIRGQMYIPFFNWFLMCAHILMVLHFGKRTWRQRSAFP
jgi:hypothetical protein